MGTSVDNCNGRDLAARKPRYEGNEQEEGARRWCGAKGAAEPSRLRTCLKMRFVHLFLVPWAKHLRPWLQ
jgi:hypothetical protein